MTVTDELLMAYADGELSGADRAEVEAAVAADPALKERLERQQRLRARLAGAFASVLDEPAPERLVEAARASNVVRFPSRRAAVPAWAAAAAALVVGVAAGLAAPRLGPQPVIGADMRAQGDLAGALQTQLASAQTAGSPVRIGLTFESADGYCRTFSLQDLAGLACREGETWKVRMAVETGAASGDYRTAASSTPPEILSAAQSLIIGEPLDAGAESAARDKGWRK